MDSNFEKTLNKMVRVECVVMALKILSNAVDATLPSHIVLCYSHTQIAR